MSYGKFRNFLILLPEAKLREADPSIAWFEAATMVPFGEPFWILHDDPACTLLSSALSLLTIAAMLVICSGGQALRRRKGAEGAEPLATSGPRAV